MKYAKLLLAFTLGGAVALFSGCGDEAKSIEELQKLSKDELKQMNKACEAVRSPAISKLGNNPSESELMKADESDVKLKKEREKIANEILKARGQKPKQFGAIGSSLFMTIADFTNEEVSKFGNSDFAKYVECARASKAYEKFINAEIMEQNKARKEKYQKLVDELGKEFGK